MKLVAALIVLFASNMAFAGECPVTDLNDYQVNVVALISAAKTCREASDIAESCAMGSSMDVGTVGAAMTVCEVDFGKKLKPSEKKTYSSLLQKCNAKYAKMQGTMYVASAAFCRLSVSQLFSNLYTPAE